MQRNTDQWAVARGGQQRDTNARASRLDSETHLLLVDGDPVGRAEPAMVLYVIDAVLQIAVSFG